jgi:outer membrane protein OmpA-like peptidoglycan-associated protein
VLRLVACLLLLAGVAHAERKVITETSIEIIGPIKFEGATAQLSHAPSTQKMLDAIAQTFNGNPSILEVEVRAYGADAKYQRGVLASARARAIVHALVARGVDPKRLVPRGFGAPRPGESADPAFFIAKRERDDERGGLLQKR